MPKKQVEEDEDIIEIEEFVEPKQDKSIKKQISSKKVKSQNNLTKKKTKIVEEEDEDEEEEEEEDEEEEEEVKIPKSKKKNLKKPISEKRLAVLKRGREIAAANRQKKKAEQIDSLKKELWDEFSKKLPVETQKPKPVSTKSEVVESESPLNIIQKLNHLQFNDGFVPSNRPYKSFSKIK